MVMFVVELEEGLQIVLAARSAARARVAVERDAELVRRFGKVRAVLRVEDGRPVAEPLQLSLEEGA